MNLFTEYTSKAHLFNLIDQTDDKLSFVDRNYIYRAVNMAYVKGFNRPVDQIVGHHVKEIMGVEVFENIVKPYLDRAFIGEEIYYESWFDFADAERAYLIVRYKPMHRSDNVIIGVAVTATDMTERKYLEEEKMFQDKLLIEQSRMADLGEMVAFMAHQWRRPLHTLSTYLLRIRHEMNTQPLLMQFDDIVERSEEILEHLSQNLESLYHFHSDQDGTVNIRTSLEEVERFLESHLNATQIILDIDMPDKMMISTTIPNYQLLNLFLVFIENAIEALEKLEQEEKKIIVSGRKDNEFVIIDIYDNGEGVTFEKACQIFEAGISSKEDNAHGYGLYFARKIITEKFGGFIELIPGEEGTCFRLRFPKGNAFK